ncbi:hypothetical protein CPB86DRAFT_815646 [Serendipita vermifera]|nr:hypothetical protein CPB86DRAFT_815646 [Serendipita vermifera]
MTILFVWRPTLLRDPRVIAPITVFLIHNVVRLLSLREGSRSSVSSLKADSKRKEPGFKVLSEGKTPVVDIVAIHGLGGHRERSWTAKNDKNGKMWLKDFLPDDIPNARILTYGHNADTHSVTYMPAQNIFSLAETFVEDLILERRTDPKRPIIFLAHSLGGIILKKALALCNAANSDQDKQCIKVSTYAVLFFGTPHSGANGIELAQWMGKLLSVYMFTDDRILTALKRDSIELQDIQMFYLYASERIRSIFFYEELPTETFTGAAEVVVPRSAAIIPGERNATVASLYADHRKMVKFQDKDDNNYRKVVGYLSNLVGEATENIHNREVQPPPYSLSH